MFGLAEYWNRNDKKNKYSERVRKPQISNGTMAINLSDHSFDSIISALEEAKERKQQEPQQETYPKQQHHQLHSVHLDWTASGRLDIILEKILELQVSNILLTTSVVRGRDPPPLPESTAEFRLTHVPMTDGMASQIKQGLFQYMNERGNNTEPHIRCMTMYDCTLMDRAANTLAKACSSDILPHLRTLTVDCRNTISNKHLAKFLKTSLLKRPSNKNAAASAVLVDASAIKTLNLVIDGNKQPEKVMSVVAEWLSQEKQSGGNDRKENSLHQENTLTKSMKQGFEHFGGEFLDESNDIKLDSLELDISRDWFRGQTKLYVNKRRTRWSNGRYQQPNKLRVFNLKEHSPIVEGIGSVAEYLESFGTGRQFITRLSFDYVDMPEQLLIHLSSQLCHLPNLISIRLHGDSFSGGFSKECIANHFLPALKQTNVLSDVSLRSAGTEIELDKKKEMQWICDINRGGQRLFVKSDPDKIYPAALWPLIFNRINNSIAFPNCDEQFARRRAFPGNVSTNDEGKMKREKNRRRTRVLYHMLVNGAMIDCVGARTDLSVALPSRKRTAAPLLDDKKPLQKNEEEGTSATEQRQQPSASVDNKRQRM